MAQWINLHRNNSLVIDRIPYGNGIGNSHSMRVCDLCLDLIKHILVPVTHESINVFSSYFPSQIVIVNYIASY